MRNQKPSVSIHPGPVGLCYAKMDWVFSGEAVTQESLGLRPRNSAQEEHSTESALQSGRRNTIMVHVLSHAFSARTLLILIPRAAP